MSSSVSYGLIIPKIYKSRNIILDILKSRGYNIEDYENFSVSDVLAMYNAVPKQLDMLLTNENNNKIYVKYHLNTVRIKGNHIREAVEDLLKKFKKNIHLIKGNSNTILKKIDMSKIDYVFLDGGHDYETVKNDLNNCSEVIDNNGTVLCDDYNLSYAPGVKKAIDEYIKNKYYRCEILQNSRFAKIEKK